MQIQEDFDLSQLLWYRIGGKTRYLLECRNETDVLQALDFVDKKSIAKTFFCGLGSNLIFSDEYFDGAVIRIVGDDSDLIKQTGDGLVESFGGEILDKVILFALDHQLIGLQWAGGLPGTVGAGVRGNVGAFGGEIKNSLLHAKIAMVQNGKVEIREYSNKELLFSYRTSLIKLQKNMVVLSAVFGLSRSSEEDVRAARVVYDGNREYRENRHPLEYPNCGSVFKNISAPDEVEMILTIFPDIKEKVEKDWHGKVSMGFLNHRLGFAGYRVGNAQVSEKHNNFIVNLGAAKAADVKLIIRDIQEKFQETFGFQPEVEVEIVE